jgi:hypothetical protein
MTRTLRSSSPNSGCGPEETHSAPPQTLAQLALVRDQIAGVYDVEHEPLRIFGRFLTALTWR